MRSLRSAASISRQPLMLNELTVIRAYPSVGADFTELTMPFTVADIETLFDLPFNDLIFRAQSVHRRHFDPNEVQLSTLLSIKTGGCPEDCGYCSQSVHADSGLKAEKLMDVDAVLTAAAEAKAAGSGRFCMGAAWREPKDRDLDALCSM